MRWTISSKTVPPGVSKKLKMKSIRFALFKISISLRTGPTGGRASGISHVHSASYYLIMRNCSRRGSSLGRHERSSREGSLLTRLTGSRRWGQPCLLGRRAGSTGGSAAKIWTNSGITTLISSALRMILMLLRITTSKHLQHLRLSLREAAQLQLPLQKQSINRSQRKREQRKSLHQTLPLIHLRQMTTTIRRKRRRLRRLA
jgi:hypothetical protein